MSPPLNTPVSRRGGRRPWTWLLLLVVVVGGAQAQTPFKFKCPKQSVVSNFDATRVSLRI